MATGPNRLNFTMKQVRVVCILSLALALSGCGLFGSSAPAAKTYVEIPQNTMPSTMQAPAKALPTPKTASP